MKKKTVLRRAKAKRPSIQFRVSQEIYERLAARADKIGVPISEVAGKWIEDFDATIKAGEQARKILSDAESLLAKMPDNFLRSRDYVRITLDRGHVWASKEAIAAGKLSLSVDAAAVIEDMKPALIKALAQSLERQKGDNQ